MAGCGDVTSLESLQIQYKHQVFEAEVITGKAGGVAGGADIDYATNQVTGQVQKTQPAIMRDLGFEPASFDFTSGGTLGVNDRSKAVLWPLSSGGDGYWYYWEGDLPKIVPASSTPASTGGVLDGAWRPVGDITLREDLIASGGAARIGTQSGKTVEQSISESGIVRGNDLKNYFIAGCAVRRDTSVSPDWQLVSDSAHIPINTIGVSATSVDVNIQYGVDSDDPKIGTLAAGPDERFAADGVLVGGSVSADNANISLGAPCSFFINFDSANAITFDTKFFGPSRFGVSVASSGLITITHPQRRLMQMPLCQHTSGASQFEPLTPHYVNTASEGVTSLYLVGEAEGLISYSGTEWTLTSSSWTSSGTPPDVTFSYDAPTAVLTVTHPQVLGSPGIKGFPWDNGGDVITLLSNVTATGFKVKFRKNDGTIPALSSALGVYFSRGVSAIRKVPTGRLNVFLGHVQVDCRQVDYQNGNFWFIAAMQV